MAELCYKALAGMPDEDIANGDKLKEVVRGPVAKAPTRKTRAKSPGAAESPAKQMRR